MLIIARSMDYSELSTLLQKKKVLVWTCNTCAKLCNRLGGLESCEKLAKRLFQDGVEIVGTVAVSASCLESHVIGKRSIIECNRSDVILSITCSIGSKIVEKVFNQKTINPITTYGWGYLANDGEPVLVTPEKNTPISQITERSSPFV